MKCLKQGILVLLLIVLSGVSHAEQAQTQYSGTRSGFEANEENYIIQHNLGMLRQFHESSIFMLKRYASLEALITAVDQNKDENEAYLVGTASLVPGAGQMINGDYLQGSLLLFATSISWASVQQLNYTKKRQKQYMHLLPYYYTSLALKNGVMTYSMLHASNRNYRDHRDRTQAMWTGMASIVPGVGQAINGQWLEAGAFLLAWSLATVATTHFEEKIFLNGDDSYLVRDPEPMPWAVAFLPGGLGLSYTTQW